MLAPGCHRINPQRQPAPEPGFGLTGVRIGQADLPAHNQIGMPRWFPGDEQALPGLKLTGSGGGMCECSTQTVIEFERQRTQAMLQLPCADGQEPRQRGLIPGQMLPECIAGNARDPTPLERNQGGVD